MLKLIKFYFECKSIYKAKIYEMELTKLRHESELKQLAHQQELERLTLSKVQPEPKYIYEVVDPGAQGFNDTHYGFFSNVTEEFKKRQEKGEWIHAKKHEVKVMKGDLKQ